ncbi:MAG: hypothetical protein HY699_18785 [Deltaproteobacteria bacterium]|nr:hypothetical protein [Deltaproteobacteria bacterium]
MARRSGVPLRTQRIERLVFADGSFLEGTITQFAPSQPIGFDYRLVYLASDGTVLILYDNQGGHAPHRHIKGTREPYRFVGIDQLVDDFLNDVEGIRREDEP